MVFAVVADIALRSQKHPGRVVVDAQVVPTPPGTHDIRGVERRGEILQAVAIGAGQKDTILIAGITRAEFTGHVEQQA